MQVSLGQSVENRCLKDGKEFLSVCTFKKGVK